MVAQKHVCICPAATRVKPYYLNFQSSAIDRSMKLNLKKEKKKKRSAEPGRQRGKKIETISVCPIGSPPCFIMCRAYFHIEIRLHLKPGRGGEGRGGDPATDCEFEKGANASV